MYVQKRPPGYALFFAPLRILLDPIEYERVEFAYSQAKSGLDKKMRDDGTRSFDHPKAATWIYIYELDGRDSDTMVVILLHDIVEDALLLPSYRIKLNFGEEIAFDVTALTKLSEEKETIEEYLFRIIERGPRAILAKLCDLLHNLRTLSGCSEEKRVRKLDGYQNHYVRLLIPALREYGGQWAVYADALEPKIKEAIVMAIAA